MIYYEVKWWTDENWLKKAEVLKYLNDNNLNNLDDKYKNLLTKYKQENVKIETDFKHLWFDCKNSIILLWIFDR